MFYAVVTNGLRVTQQYNPCIVEHASGIFWMICGHSDKQHQVNLDMTMIKWMKEVNILSSPDVQNVRFNAIYYSITGSN